MATTWDWSPVVQAFGGFMQEQQQKQQYDKLLQSLLGPEGATTPQPQPAQGLIGRLLNPQGRQQPQQSPLAQAQPMQMNPEDLTGDQVQPQQQPLNNVGKQYAGPSNPILDMIHSLIGNQGRPPQNPAGNTPAPNIPGGVPQSLGDRLIGGGGSDALRGSSPLGGIDPRMADLFRRLPPQIGMPLLLQTIQQGMAPRSVAQFDPEKDVVDPRTGDILRHGIPKGDFKEKGTGINPETKKLDTYGIDNAGNVKWLGIEPAATPSAPTAPNSPERQQQLLDIAKARGTQAGNVQSVQQAADGSLIVVHRDGTVEHMSLDGTSIKGTQAPEAVFNRSAAQSGGKAAGTAAESFPTVTANYNIIKDTLDAFDDPKVKAQAPRAIGVGGYLPAVPGFNSDFRARVDQLQGQTFLQAFNTLKGGGQITEVEGAKATAAIARLNKVQSPTEFYKALNDARKTFSDLYEASKTRAARGAVVPQMQNNPAPPISGGGSKPMTAVGPNSQRIQWDGKAWVPVQ